MVSVSDGSPASGVGKATSSITPAERARLIKLLDAGGFTAMCEANPDGVFAYALDGNFIAANHTFIRRSEFSVEEMNSRPIGAGVVEEHKRLTAQQFAAVAAGHPRTWRATIYTKSGSLVHVLTTAFPFYVDGVCQAVIGTVRDIDLLEQTQAQARKLEDRITQTLDSMPDSIVLVNRDWQITYGNPRAVEMTGIASADLIGADFWQSFPEAKTSKYGQTYLHVMGGAEREQFRAFNPYNERWIEVTTYPTADGIAIYSRDVNEEEERRAQLAQSERRTITQAALLDAARDAMVVRNLDGSIAYWNRAATDVYGWTATEAVGSMARGMLYDDPIQYDKAVIQVLTAGYWSGTLHQRTKDGRKIIVDGRWTLVHTADGQPDSIFIVNTDVTEQVQLEKQELRAQRMESLGRLAGGIAHDLNNVLTPILMSAQMLKESQKTDPDRDLAAGIERAAMRGADLIRQVLTFARGDDGARERVDVRALIADLDSFCRETLPKSIAVTMGVARNIADVRGDKTQLMQVLINLVVNARDAMPEGGMLRITAFGSAATLVTSEVVVIEVEDNGTGMDPATLETIFDPFFTTKLLGSGTGLGLATSLSIAQRHEGTLTATSSKGAGTLLRLELPALPPLIDEEPRREEELASDVPRGNGELILVVDDEIAIRRLNCQTLEAAGYSTLVAANGQDGIDVYETNAERIALVLTDLMMPVLDGLEMARELRTAGYSGPILATSGGIRSTAPIDEIEGTRFLSKPYTTRGLLVAVHEMIAADT